MIPREHIPEDTKMSFNEEFPSLCETNNNNNNNNSNKNKRFSKPRSSSISSNGSNSSNDYCINNIQYSSSNLSNNNNNHNHNNNGQSPNQFISKYIDMSDGNTDSWKKRDLLYFCFIQRHHEIGIIAEFVEGIAQLYSLPASSSLLDAGCGLGRLFSEWDRSPRWSSVDAMEPDLDYWTFASDHAINTSDKVSVVHGGFLDINVHCKYNMVTAIHGPFQYLLRLEDRLEALRRIWLSLKPGGVFILDVSNFLLGLSQLRTQTEHKMLVNGIPVKRVSNIDVDFHNAVWRLEDIFFSVDGGDADPNGEGNGYGDGQYVVENHSFSIFTLPELQLLLASTGFINLRSTSKYCIQSLITGNITDGPRIIISAQKPHHQIDQ